jgi:UDP-N-acetylglucosamine 2-epimerase (non-hydrolysing)
LSIYTVVAGTRPEIIKVAPIIRKILQSKKKLYFVHTGQHYDYSLSEQMINDLQLPVPNMSFELKKSPPASQIAEIMTKLEKPLMTSRDNIVIVQGDTNSVLSAALTAIKVRTPLAHVEAGLRSHDWRMPEEHNRRMVDHISNVLFPPTKESEQNLINEQVYGKIYVTGNTVIDAVREHLPLAEKKSEILQNVIFSEYIVVTIHRAENVDDPIILGNIVQAFIQSEVPIVIPLHPRTKNRLIDFGFFKKLKSTKNIQIIPPLGYLDFLLLMKHSKFIVTDSGGIQEEATSPSLSKRILVLRRSTERPETIQTRVAKLVPLESKKIVQEISAEWNATSKIFSSSPYGDGSASEKIINILKKLIPELSNRELSRQFVFKDNISKRR